MLKQVLFLIVIGLKSILSLSQQNDSTYYYLNNQTPLKTLQQRIKLADGAFEEHWYKLVGFIKQKENDSILSYLNFLEKRKPLTKIYQARFQFLKGIYYSRIDNDSLKFNAFYLANKLAEQHQDTLTILKSLEQLSQTYDNNNDNYYNKSYLDLFHDKALLYNLETFRIKHAFLSGNYYLFQDKNKQALKNYKRALQFNFNSEDSVLITAIYNNLGVLYSENLNKPDSALYYLEQQSNFLNQKKKYSNIQSLFNNYLNMGSAHEKLGNFQNAKKFYLLADSLFLKSNYLKNKSHIKENLAWISEKTENYKEAYRYLDEYIELSDSLKKEEQRTAITNIKEQYDNEKLRADNLESESKRKQNRNLLIGALVFIVFGGTTAFLIQKNTRKKQKLAEQEKALETQKLATVLKEQELVSIDAMIEGQEKERQRIANDLHDDLGGLMATVKLHFNVLKDKQTPELYYKTTSLLDEAYQKIRSIAHAKNSGVIAKQGLLKAVQNMADNISASNKIAIAVIDHGLENRMENSLELTIFRVIQELIANVIKHANATEATIHLTNHDDSLNIMVEDNGIGFNPSQITTKNKGMGLSSIDKRVEFLDGKMTIESGLNKGTTIIIDIPV